MSKKDATAVDIDRQAVRWHNLLQAGEPTQQQLVDYIEWLRASPRHEAAIAEYETARGLLAELAQDADIAGLLAVESEQPDIVQRSLAGKMRWLAACATAVLAIGALFYFYQPAGDQYQSAARYVTALGEQKTHRLADGTQITLNTATEIVVLYSGKERLIKLQRGEALFDVASDSERPFTVSTRFGHTRALGTLFNVRVRADRVDVALLAGAVEVAAADKAAVRRLVEGQQVSYRTDGTLSPTRAVKADDVLLWTKRKLNFKGTRLQDVVAEINRYSARKLVIDDPSMNDMTITLRLGVDNIDSFLSVSEEVFGIKPEYQFGKVVLSRAPAPAD